MFEKLREKCRLARIDREMREFDQKYNQDKNYFKENMYGEWDGMRWNYQNGLYAIPKEKDYKGNWILELFSKDGKKLDEAELMDIANWHHNFVRVDFKYIEVDKHYDRLGNCLTCLGVFCTDDEVGDNLYVVPYVNGKYFLYNHKNCFMVGDEEDSCIFFDGFKGVKGDNGEKLILGMVSGQSESTGFGKLCNTRYYDEFYQIDLNGKILKKWKEWKKDGEELSSSTSTE